MKEIRRGFVVSHPERQHSNRVAEVLSADHKLVRYYSGTALQSSTSSIPRGSAALIPIAPVTRRLLEPLLGFSDSAAACVRHAAHCAFDLAISTRIQALGADGVISYEGAALRTFRAARRYGMHTILDAASVHHATQDSLSPSEVRPAIRALVNRRKDEEAALADRILVCSSIAAESYLRAGFPPSRITVVPLGVDIQQFFPVARSDHGEPFTFIFVGNRRNLKGLEILESAFSLAVQQSGPLRLWLVGSGHEHARVGTCLGKLSQFRLAETLRRADCLVLPSLFDSFGLVVLEAMSSGVPVIVSDRVGSKDLIQPGVEGLVVPAGKSAPLAEAMLTLARSPSLVRAMGTAARSTALRFTWEAYGRRLLQALAET